MVKYLQRYGRGSLCRGYHGDCRVDFAFSLPNIDGIIWGKILLDWGILGDYFAGFSVIFGAIFAKIQ